MSCMQRPVFWVVCCCGFLNGWLEVSLRTVGNCLSVNSYGVGPERSDMKMAVANLDCVGAFWGGHSCCQVPWCNYPISTALDSDSLRWLTGE
jgi:hypothetical protein